MLEEDTTPQASKDLSSKPFSKRIFAKNGYSQVHEEEDMQSLDGASVREEFELETEKKAGIKERCSNFILHHRQAVSWAMLICGLFCVSWIGPCFKYLSEKGVGATRRACWRSQALLILLLIPSYFEYRSLTPEQKKLLFNWQTAKQLLICGLLWLLELSLWSNGLEFTSVPRASIFANSSSLLLVIYYKLSKQSVSGMEIGGTITGFTGLLTAVLGTHFFGAGGVKAESSLWFMGDLLCFGSAVSIGAYIIRAGPTRAKVSVFLYTLSNTFILAVGLGIASIATEHTTFDTSANGLFGWTKPEFMVVVGTLSVVAGMIGFNLNVYSVKYVPPLAYALVSLCDPLVSGVYAYLIGVDGIPGVFTFIGGGITIVGIVTLLVGQNKRVKKEKEAAAIKATLEKDGADETNTDNDNDNDDSKRLLHTEVYVGDGKEEDRT